MIQDWVPLNDLRRGVDEQGDDLRAAVQSALASGWFLEGPEASAFGADLASYLGSPGVALVGNGTDALEIALRALMPAGRRVVLTVANAGTYATVAARRNGYDVVFADVDPETHCLDVNSLRDVVDDRVGVVVATHLYGRACPMSDVLEAARAVGAKVLEDCAQALGAVSREGMVGSLGDAASFSFYPTKNLGALGDGGAVASGDYDVLQRVRALRQYGWQDKYDIGLSGGSNSRMDELQAAVLKLRLPRLDGWNAKRRAIIGEYVARAPEGLRVLPAEGPGHVGHLAVVEARDRSRFARHLDARRVKSAVHYPIADHRQPAFASDYQSVSLPVAERLSGRVISLPVFPQMRPDEIDRVGEALATFAP